MLLYLFYDVLQRYFHALNVFRYITVRTALASLTALLTTFVLGPWVIQKLRELQIGQFINHKNAAVRMRNNAIVNNALIGIR